MESVVMCGGGVAPAGAKAVGVAHIARQPVTFARVELPAPAFDPAGADRMRVLVRTAAFSLNYRDKAYLLGLLGTLAPGEVRPVGSEFVGTIVAIGDGIESYVPGDRVIANASYPFAGPPGTPMGLPTEGGSAEILKLDALKITKIPREMTDEVAASFTVGAQTVCSMLRRTAVEPKDRVLVMAGTSNTGLFAIEALRHTGATVYATTTSEWGRAQLEKLQLSGGVFQIDPRGGDLAEHEALLAAARAGRGFSVVVDPYADLYLGRVLNVMSPYGRYVTCGFFGQYHGLTGERFEYNGMAGGEVLRFLLIKNISVIGNCLGKGDDLRAGLRAWKDGHLAVHVDSVYRGDDAAAFIERSFEARERLGKVVFSYS